MRGERERRERESECVCVYVYMCVRGCELCQGGCFGLCASLAWAIFFFILSLFLLSFQRSWGKEVDEASVWSAFVRAGRSGVR